MDKLPRILLLVICGLLAAPVAAVSEAHGADPDATLSITPSGWPFALSIPELGVHELREQEGGAAGGATLVWEEPEFDWMTAKGWHPGGGMYIHRITAGWAVPPEGYAAAADWTGLEELSHDEPSGFEVHVSGGDMFAGEPGLVELDGRQWRFADLNLYIIEDDRRETPPEVAESEEYKALYGDVMLDLRYHSSKYCYTTLHEGRVFYVNFYFSFFREYDAAAQRAWCESLLGKAGG